MSSTELTSVLLTYILSEVCRCQSVTYLSATDLQRSCDELQKYHQAFAVVVQIIVGSKLSLIPSMLVSVLIRELVIVIIRTYAIYERRRSIGILLIATAFGVICVGVVSHW